MDNDLRLVEMFHTFQGEGKHWGRRAFFVRLPYCNLKCSWCDTSFNQFTKFSEEEFLNEAAKEPHRFAVITGGEPTMNKQTPRIIELLKSKGYEIAIETNGTFPIPDGIDFVTVSPKRDANFEIHADAALKANEVKIVVDADFDFNICKIYQEQEWTKLVRLSLSPEFNNLQESIKRIEEYIVKNPQWRVSLQTHKFMGVR